MKIRTEIQLQENLDRELAWRRLDLIRLRQLILQNEKHELLQKTLLRSSIPILYAHWEGFVKESSTYFVHFIAMRKLFYKNLTKGMLAVHISETILSSGGTLFEKSVSLIELFEDRISDRSNIKSIPKPINTKSNLNTDVLKEIIDVLELDYEKFRGYEVLINNQLLEARNKIAHGEYREISYEFYDQLHSTVIELIVLFNNEIQNCVSRSRYKRPYPEEILSTIVV